MAECLNQAEDPEDPLVNRLLRMMATGAMSQAVYFATGAQSQDQYQSKSQFYHYGMTKAHIVSVHHCQKAKRDQKVLFPVHLLNK